MDEFKPGQVIQPQQMPSTSTDAATEPLPQTGAPEPERPLEQPAGPTVAPPEPVQPPQDTPQQSADQATETWQYSPAPLATDEQPAEAAASRPSVVTWTASEFLVHDKGGSWYIMLAIGGVAAAGLAYLLTHDKVSSGIIVFAVGVFGWFAARKPSTQSYQLTPQGVQIGQRSYTFNDFKTFSVGDEGSHASVIFMPLKRFMLPLTIYIAPEVQDQVIDLLASVLPFEAHHTDMVDSLLRRLRF